MNNSELFDIVAAFRAAIVEAKHDWKFDSRDRMSGFPGGCCDDTSDLLGHYLVSAHGKKIYAFKPDKY